MYELVFASMPDVMQQGIREHVYVGISEIPTIRFKQHFFGSHNRGVRHHYEIVRDPEAEYLIYTKAGISTLKGDVQLELAGVQGNRIIRNMPDFRVYGYPSMQDAAIAERSRYFALQQIPEIELLNQIVPTGKP